MPPHTAQSAARLRSRRILNLVRATIEAGEQRGELHQDSVLVLHRVVRGVGEG